MEDCSCKACIFIVLVNSTSEIDSGWPFSYLGTVFQIIVGNLEFRPFIITYRFVVGFVVFSSCIWRSSCVQIFQKHGCCTLIVYWFFSFFLISFSCFFSFWMIETFVIGMLIPVSERYNLYGRDDSKFSQLYPLCQKNVRFWASGLNVAL